MSIEVWILMEQAALDTAWDEAHPTDDSDIPADVQLLNQGVRGFWKDLPDSGSDYEVVNVVSDDIQPILDFEAANAADIFAIYGWTQGNGLDNDGTEGGFETIPQGVLDVMKDHVVYDENGDVVSTTPATFDNPNWGHVFLGQTERDFAGQFSLEFSREFF
jgi:hypothetical protein